MRVERLKRPESKTEEVNLDYAPPIEPLHVLAARCSALSRAAAKKVVTLPDTYGTGKLETAS